jgi:SAM-dependent methyltransferase
MNPTRACPICKAIQVDVLHSQRFVLPEDHPLATGYEVVACQACGFVYADTPLTQEDYDKFYTELSIYGDQTTSTGGVENPLDWKRQQDTACQIAAVLDDTALSILDVGCANGGMLRALQQLGYKDLCGLDPSPVCVENTRKLGIQAYQGRLLQPFRQSAFDCLILSHTLEHVRDVAGAIEWIERCVKPGGVVYLETPDAERYTDFLYAPFQDFNTEHINHFSLAFLRRLMESRSFSFIEGATKDLVIEGDRHYPAVYGFWRRTKSGLSIDQTHNRQLRDNLRLYIARSSKMMEDMDERISSLIAQNRSIIVWGTGQLTMKLLAETSLSRVSIEAFVDNNPVKHGKVLSGRPILAPAELKNYTQPILIASTLHFDSIARQIRNIGCDNQILSLQGEVREEVGDLR